MIFDILWNWIFGILETPLIWLQQTAGTASLYVSIQEIIRYGFSIVRWWNWLFDMQYLFQLAWYTIVVIVALWSYYQFRCLLSFLRGHALENGGEPDPWHLADMRTYNPPAGFYDRYKY